jgi:glycosyltransferase involved in cell wall biosynthesis
MRLCIDASNIRAGGGVTHLLELLRHGDPVAAGFDEVHLWAPRATLARIGDRTWLHKRWLPVLEAGYLRRALWQRMSLATLARADRCALLFAPGGSFSTSFRPVVTMSRNMLPFEAHEVRRYGFTAYRLKLELLRRVQSSSLRKADARIFLTQFAHDRITQAIGPFTGHTRIVPHGVDERFVLPPRPPRALSDCNEASPLRLLYVSTIDLYKHQAEIARAVATLHAAGLPLTLDLVGGAGAYPPALAPLQSTLRALDPQARFLRYHGAVPYEQLAVHYRAADIAVFASSCENMPNTLLEMMAASLPIACAARGPMPEVLGDAGLYFDPEDRPTPSTRCGAWLRMRRCEQRLRARQASGPASGRGDAVRSRRSRC